MILLKITGNEGAPGAPGAPGEGVEVGHITAFSAASAPTGWLECDGSTISRAAYAALFTAIGTTFGVGDGSTTFGIPDLRGEFIRGFDNGRGVDTGRAFGSAQSDAFQGHYHDLYSNDNNTLGGGSSGKFVIGASSNSIKINTVNTSAGTNVRDAITNFTDGTPRTSAETRPRNVALLACIKY